MRPAVGVLGLLALVCPACGFQSREVATDGSPPIDAPVVDAPDASMPDAPPDAPPDGPPPCQSFSQQVDTCLLTLSGDLTIQGASTYNTDTHILLVIGTPTSVNHAQLATH